MRSYWGRYVCGWYSYQKENLDTEMYTRTMSCEHEGREWGDASIS